MSAVTVPDTKVLAIASHVSYGYVGNTMATFVMQRLGCEVAAIHTVHFSMSLQYEMSSGSGLFDPQLLTDGLEGNHTGYRQFKGTKATPTEIQDLYEGLKMSDLTDFDVLLSGYIPSAEVLKVVSQIAQDLRQRNDTRPGSFFWILDPVMGDQGNLYVSEDLVAGYKSVIRDADMILPNQFEIEVLTGVRIMTDSDGAELQDITKAIGTVHKTHGVKHVVVTSAHIKGKNDVLCVIGSSAKSNGESRLFCVEVPVLDCFFSGTGDMFAALMVGRMRSACQTAGVLDRPGWISDDNIQPSELPLAKATCQVLSSMQMVLEKTMVTMKEELNIQGKIDRPSGSVVGNQDQSGEESKREYLVLTKAAEVRVVKNAEDLVQPEHRYTATAIN